MKTILMKSGKTLEFTQDVVNILMNKLDEGEEQVIFRDTKGNVVSMVNVNEIAGIV